VLYPFVKTLQNKKEKAYLEEIVVDEITAVEVNTANR
jgi:hypothetical protein